jgi:phosphoribosyl 1,2-cyclic phosphodiesterase
MNLNVSGLEKGVTMQENIKSKVAFWGVRGTCPVSGEHKKKYGGHTPCASITTPDKSVIIIDAGTGIKDLGDRFMSDTEGLPSCLHIFLTHFHLDHIMGLPFFGPLYSADIKLVFYADCLPEETEARLNGLMGGIYFPVSFQETSSKKIFRRIPDEGISVGGSRISFCPLNHPQGSVSYKIQDESGTIVLATDTEHPHHGIDKRLADFASGSDILVYDATFTPEEYSSERKGWGHSTWLEGTKLAEQAGVGNLYLSHLNPNHRDSQIDEILSLAQKEFVNTFVAMEKSG